MIIDVVKYYITNRTFKELLDQHTNIKVPKGYKELNGKLRQEKNKSRKKSKL